MRSNFWEAVSSKEKDSVEEENRGRGIQVILFQRELTKALGRRWY